MTRPRSVKLVRVDAEQKLILVKGAVPGGGNGLVSAWPKGLRATKPLLPGEHDVHIELKNAEGKAAGTVELDSSVFGIEPNIPVIHQVVTVQLGNLRQGTHDTKGRSEVSGGGAALAQKAQAVTVSPSIRATAVGGGGPSAPPAQPQSSSQQIRRSARHAPACSPASSATTSSSSLTTTASRSPAPSRPSLCSRLLASRASA